MSSGHDEYWDDYNHLQRIKHKVLRCYLGGWFPKLSKYNSKIVYLETHAGRGRHSTGDEGSPLVALRTLLDHTARDQILKNTEVVFYFVEDDSDNVKLLQAELDSITIPAQVKVHLVERDYNDCLDEVIQILDLGERTLAPCFFFIDPFGFKLDMSKVARLLKEPKTEALINFMWRNVNQALKLKSQHPNLDALFGPGKWAELEDIKPNSARCDEAVRRLVDFLSADFDWHMKMKSATKVIKYALVFVSNHQDGSLLMKDCIWKVSPNTPFEANQRGDEDYLFPDLVDLRALSRAVWDEFEGKTERLHDTYRIVDQSPFRRTHYHSLVREWRRDRNIAASGYAGRFGMSKNPLIEFKSRPGKN